jgi:hypothetical protein
VDEIEIRFTVTEAARGTGFSGTAIFLAIRRGQITTERDGRGYDWVDPDEVSTLAVQRRGGGGPRPD